MHKTTLLKGIIALLAITACNPFRSPFKHAPVVEMSTKDANVNARWNATLASPVSLAGVVKIGGSGLMQPGSNAGNTRVAVDLTNATPGARHPWGVHFGQCGDDQGVFGPVEAYNSLKVDDQGRASAAVTVPLAMPVDGRYYVSVAASVANPTTIVACGNLAPPSR